jgi:hypothetical protein
MSPFEKLSQVVAEFPDEHFCAGRFPGTFWANVEDPTLIGGWVRSNGSLHEHHLALVDGSQLLSIDKGLWLNEVTVAGEFASKGEAISLMGQSTDGHPYGAICDLVSNRIVADAVVLDVYESIVVELWLSSFGGIDNFACHIHSTQLRNRSESLDVRLGEMRKALSPLEKFKAAVAQNQGLIDRNHVYMNGVRKLSVLQFISL